MQTLAELFDVSRRTIGNALAEVRPLLETDGFRLLPAPSRLRSAADLLAPITPQDGTPTDPKPPR
jgi:transcriptional antiterminator